MKSIEPKKSLVEQTYEILLDAICTGELPPGERLSQDDIAAKLNVSRQPVNSAISILKANRFVEDTGRRRVVVTPIDPSLFQSIYEFRAVIEPFAVELAGNRIPRDARSQADRILLQGRDAVRKGDVRDLLEADIAFHCMIYNWSGNGVVEASMRVNWHHIRRSMAEVLRDPKSAIPVWDEHSNIVEALLEGKVAQASAGMRNHIERAFSKIAAAMAKS